jgi:hypothetical protein
MRVSWVRVTSRWQLPRKSLRLLNSALAAIHLAPTQCIREFQPCSFPNICWQQIY